MMRRTFHEIVASDLHHDVSNNRLTQPNIITILAETANLVESASRLGVKNMPQGDKIIATQQKPF
jgi:hypothetical protein